MACSSSSTCTGLHALVCTIAIATIIPWPALAETIGLAPAHSAEYRRVADREDGLEAQRSIAIEAGSGRVVTIAGAAANVFVADPKIVQVRPASASALFVFGLSRGVPQWPRWMRQAGRSPSMR